MNEAVFRAIGKPLLKRAAHRAITDRNRHLQKPECGKFDSAEVNRILDKLWQNYDELVGEIPHEPTIGAQLNVRAAGLGLAFYRTLLGEGIDKEYAKILINDTLWHPYKAFAFLPRLTARLITRDVRKQIRICVKMFLLFPFSEPGYRFEIIPDDDKNNAIAIKWFRCPIIDFLRKHHADDLCLACFCNLDFALMEYWGGQFERPCVQAVEGAEYCHMRFNVIPRYNCT
jgi:hypothetical protein